MTWMRVIRTARWIIVRISIFLKLQIGNKPVQIKLCLQQFITLKKIRQIVLSIWLACFNFYSCNYTTLHGTYHKKAQILHSLIIKLIDHHVLSKLCLIYVEMELIAKKCRNDRDSSPQLIVMTWVKSDLITSKQTYIAVQLKPSIRDSAISYDLTELILINFIMSFHFNKVNYLFPVFLKWRS